MIDFSFRVYQGFARFFSHFQSLFILLLRLIWGHQFMIAGYGKIANIESTKAFFNQLNIPLSDFSAYMVAGFELVCGTFLIIGFLSRFSALITTIIMITAYLTAHIHVFSFEVFRDPSLYVKEAPFPFLLMSLVVLFFGPGKVAIDRWIQKHYDYRDGYY